MLAALLALAPGAARARPLLAVAAVGARERERERAQKISAEMARALGASGLLRARSLEGLERALRLVPGWRGCRSMACWAALGRAAGADALLAVSVRRTRRGGECTLRAALFEVASARTASRAGAEKPSLLREASGRGACDAAGLRQAAARVLGRLGGNLSASDPAPMAFVPAGVFLMGFEGQRQPACCWHKGGAGVQHMKRIYLDSFYIDRHEVTVAQYRRCVRAGACTPPAKVAYDNWRTPGRERHPVHGVTWYQASAYCAWVGKRLPTEAEWEKAARGTDGRRYPWGSEAPTCNRVVMGFISRHHDGPPAPAWVTPGPGCGRFSTMPVGSLPGGESPYGVQNMAGNVIEWTASWMATTSRMRSRNPKGPRTGREKVLRGGSFEDSAQARHSFGADFDTFLADHRYFRAPNTAEDGIGFRCAMTP
jgi:formylglycine-generating enzyme required for sulfatase activity